MPIKDGIKKVILPTCHSLHALTLAPATFCVKYVVPIMLLLTSTVLI